MGPPLAPALRSNSTTAPVRTARSSSRGDWTQRADRAVRHSAPLMLAPVNRTSQPRLPRWHSLLHRGGAPHNPPLCDSFPRTASLGGSCRTWYAATPPGSHRRAAGAVAASTGGSVESPTATDTPTAAAAGEGAMAADEWENGSQAPQVLAGKTVGVVGGGPGGMLCAAHLACLGASVEVFERHDPAAVDANSPPPAVWSIVLNACAKSAIESCGLSPDFGPKWKFEGFARQLPDKPAQFFGKWTGMRSPGLFGDMIAFSTQPGIVAHLAAECERVYGDSVTVTHGMHAVGGRVCRGEVVLEDAAGERTTRQFDLVVGADGSRSIVRQLMAEQDSDMKVRVTESAMGIVCANVRSPGHPSTFSTLPTPSGAPFKAVPDGLESPLHGCVANTAVARKGSRYIGAAALAYRHSGTEVSFAITGDAAWLRQKHTQEEIESTLVDAYPQVPRVWLEEFAASMHSKSVDGTLRVRAPKFVTCSKVASGRAILIGDAGHSVSPNVGMGCNAALQDSEVLSRACVAAAGDVAAAGQAFNAERLANVQMLTHVSRQMDGVESFKFHKRLFTLLRGLPYYLPMAVSYASRRAPGKIPGWLQPKFVLLRTFQDWEDWTRVRGAVRAYASQMAALLVATLALVCAVACKGFSLVRAAA